MTAAPAWDFLDMPEDAGIGALLVNARLPVPVSAVIENGQVGVEVDFEPPHPPRFIRPGPGFLDDFMELATAHQHIRRFAARYGPLELCQQHGLPFTHTLLTRHITGDNQRCSLVVKKLSGGRMVIWEPVERWVRLAETARAIVNIVARWENRKPQDIAQFKLLPGWAGGDDVPADPLPTIAVIVNHWLKWCRFEFRLDDAGPHPALYHFGVPAVFARLAWQLALTANRAGGLAICSNCHHPYRPRRKPNPNRENYCKKCGIQAAWRDAQRRRREG